MNDEINMNELVAYIVEHSQVERPQVENVLKHEQEYINKAHAGSKGEVDIDSDDLVDYILGKRDVRLDEIKVESILDLEMEYLMDKGLAGYID